MKVYSALLFLTGVAVARGAGASLPWVEDFSGLANGAKTDVGETSWTVSSDYGQFEIKNGVLEIFSNAQGTFTSGGIDVSAVKFVEIKTSLYGDNGLDSSGGSRDHVQVYAELDNGRTLLVSHKYGGSNGFQEDLIGIVDVSDIDTMSLKIKAKTTGGSEIYHFQDIRVVPVGDDNDGCTYYDLNMDNLAEGTYVSDQFSASHGVNLACNCDDCGGGQCRVFDTANPVGDPDLGSPNEHCPGSGPKPGKGSGGMPGTAGENCWPVGHILIVDENGNNVPDDAVGGDITFTFAQPVEFLSIDQLDNEGSEHYKMEFYRGNSLVTSVNGAYTGDNGYAATPLLAEQTRDIDKMKLVLSGSGSVNSVKYRICPEPPPPGPLVDCHTQKDCITFTKTQICEDDCNASVNGGCYVEVCMHILDNERCAKDLASETISHSCEKDSTKCYDDATGFDTDAVKTGGVGAGHSQCQKIVAGGTAEFMLKDGSDKWCEAGDTANAAPYIHSFGGVDATCRTLYNLMQDSSYVDGHCGGGTNNHQKECVWQIPTDDVTCDECTTTPPPPQTSKEGGAGGDPYFKRWNRKSFEFHGACDLVLVHSDHVNGNKDLDVHVRTVITEWWSQIESAAMRIGDMTLQMEVDKFFINGQEHSDLDLPIQTSEFFIAPPFYGNHAATQSIRGTGKNVLKSYLVTFNDKSAITFKLLRGFMNVEVSGHSDDFEHSNGLMGDYDLGKPYNRAGERMYDLNEFAMEWQVNPAVDPVLFLEAKGPQLPHEQCHMPSPTATARRGRRRLQVDKKFYTAAEEACADKGDEIDACMNDVMAVGDVAMALLH